MRMITPITIDLYGDTQYYLVSAKQGDRATRFVEVTLMNRGVEFELPSGIFVFANIKKPDGTYCYNNCEIDGNAIMVELTSGALAAAGTAFCDIELRTEEGGEILSSASFTIEIEPSMRNEAAILSTNEAGALDVFVAQYIDRLVEKEEEFTAFSEEASRAEAERAVHYENKENPHGVTKGQVGLGSVTNDAQVKRDEMGKANGVATLDENGEVPKEQLPALSASDIKAVPTTRKINGKALSSDIKLSASDVGAVPNAATPISENSNLNDYTSGGLYSCQLASVAVTIANCPVADAFLLTVKTIAGVTMQNWEGISGVKCSRISQNASSFGEWEYENPPMEAGVEYRTTERYKGKAVYCQLVEIGDVEGTKTVDYVGRLYSQGATNKVRTYVGSNLMTTTVYLPLYATGTSSDKIVPNFNSKNVSITASGYAFWGAFAVIWYTLD